MLTVIFITATITLVIITPVIVIAVCKTAKELREGNEVNESCTINNSSKYND